MKEIIETLGSTGSIVDVKHTTPTCSCGPGTNIAAVLENVAESPEITIHYYAPQLEISTAILYAH